MKFGIHSGLWMTRWTDDVVPIMRTVAELGYDGIELSLLGITKDRAETLRSAACDHDLEITCSTGLGPSEDPTSADADVGQAALAALEDAVGTTAALGARQLAGVIYAPWGVFDPVNKVERAQRSAELLGRLDGLLESADVKLAIEAINRFETDLVNTAEEAAALAEASGSSRIGVLLDTFHMNIEQKNSAAAIRQTADRLFHFHVSDSDRGVPGSAGYNFVAAAEALRTIGYDGWITAEMFVVPGYPTSADLNIWRPIEADPTEAARQALEFMRATF